MIGLYFLHDDLAGKSGPVFEAAGNAVALRQCMSILRRMPPEIRKDMSLYHLGDFDGDKRIICINPGVHDLSGGGLNAVKIDDLSIVNEAIDKEAVE